MTRSLLTQSLHDNFSSLWSKVLFKLWVLNQLGAFLENLVLSLIVLTRWLQCALRASILEYHLALEIYCRSLKLSESLLL